MLPKKLTFDNDLRVGRCEQELKTIGFIFTVSFALKNYDKDQEVAIKGKPFSFNMFLVGDIVAFFSSVIVVVVLGIRPSVHRNNLVLFSKVVLCIAIVFFMLSFLAAVYLLMSAGEKWVAMSVALGTLAVLYPIFLYIISMA